MKNRNTSFKIPRNKFYFIFSIAVILGGFSIIIYALTQKEIFYIITAVCAIFGGVSITGLRIGSLRNKFRIILSIAAIVGGLSAIIYTLGQKEVFHIITAISAIIGGVSIVGLGISWLNKSKRQ